VRGLGAALRHIAWPNASDVTVEGMHSSGSMMRMLEELVHIATNCERGEGDGGEGDGGRAHGCASCRRSKDAASMTPHASALAGPAYLVLVPSTKKNGTAPSLHPVHSACAWVASSEVGGVCGRFVGRVGGDAGAGGSEGAPGGGRHEQREP
jgi:hypothetical protein